uniref:Uncharacterized protein n=1 Tax=Octopus bimaculoides TaxID=37653 RepID=A0A0L8GPQ3_OCTBM
MCWSFNVCLWREREREIDREREREGLDLLHHCFSYITHKCCILNNPSMHYFFTKLHICDTMHPSMHFTNFTITYKARESYILVYTVSLSLSL